MLVISIGFIASKPSSSILELAGSYGTYSVSDSSSTTEHTAGFSFKSYGKANESDTFGFVGGGVIQMPLSLTLNGVTSNPSYRYAVNVILNAGMWKGFNLSDSADMVVSGGFALKEIARVTYYTKVLAFDVGAFANASIRYWTIDNVAISAGINALAYLAEYAYFETTSSSTTGFTEDFFAYELIPYIAGTIYIPMK